LENDLRDLSGSNSIMMGAMLLICLAVMLTLVISTAQSIVGETTGSDHPVRVFLTRRIRKNGFRLFVRLPDLLNDCYCAAVPLYVHWIIAHFKSRAVFWGERLLHPVVNSLHVGLLAGIAIFTRRQEGPSAEFAGITACLFALTPQFYHALSARGTGLLLLTAFFAAAYTAARLDPA
jgi:hypothetical protein